MNTYGKVELRGRKWLITCAPHVRTKLKRTFPRAPQEAGDVVAISNTPENARDLEWFMQRYPLSIAWLDQDQLQKAAQGHRDTEGSLAELLAGRRPPVEVPLAEPAREYQKFAAQMLEVKRGLLLADDVGLGKTVSAICSMVRSENLPCLVVCPAHMPRQWEAAINRFAPHLAAHRIRGGKPYTLMRANARRIGLLPDRIPDVLIVSYHTLRTWSDILAPLVRFAVYDECQQLRNSGSAIYVASKHVADKAPLRLGLSATPIYNYGSEFFWVIDALQPGALGERSEFVREWCRGGLGDKARIADTEEFGGYLRREGIMLRRTRKDVGRELPPLTKVVHTIEADTDILERLNGNAISLARIVLKQNERYRGERMHASGEFDAMMRQATGIAKAPYVAEFVKMLCDSGEKIVLFGWHREVYSIWIERLSAAGLEPVLYTGSESPSQKAASVKRFTSGESQVLIMSLRSGAGVDGLQEHCRISVFGELDWSPGVHEQCMGRVDRDGQAEPGLAYFMVADGGADPVMAEILGVKRQQIEGVRNPDNPLIERIETGEHHIRAVAREFLRRRGEVLPEDFPTVLELTPPPAAHAPELHP